MPIYSSSYYTIILDVQFIQTELDTFGFHGPVHVQKGSSVPDQNLPGPA